MPDIVDDAQVKEQELLHKALSSSTQLTATPKNFTQGICYICQQPINPERQAYWRSQKLTAFLCGDPACENAYLNLKPIEVTYLPDVEEETTDD